MFLISDSHNDFLTSNECNLEKLNSEFKKNNVALCNAILFSKDKNFSIHKARQLKEKISKYSYLKQHCIFSFENLNFLTSNEIEKLIEFKPFSCSLTWNYKNQFACGAQDYGGLTYKGKHLIKQLIKNKIMIDTAHLNRQSFWQIINYIDMPLFNSHTCFNLTEHRRNLDIEQIKAIVDSKGFVGITFVSSFLTNNKTCTIDDVYKNIDSIVQKFGVDNVGIGSDFYGTKNLPSELKNYFDFKKLFDSFTQHGYKKQDITKIISLNFNNFVKNNIF